MKKMLLIIVFLSCVFYGKTQVFVTESEAVTVTSKYMQHYLDDTLFQAKEVSRVDVLKKEGHVLLYEVCYKKRMLRISFRCKKCEACFRI